MNIDLDIGGEFSEIGCTCKQINGETISTEDINFKFCPFCVECFEGMTIANDYESLYGEEKGDDNA
ncbi:hypothetical protein [Acinetobacter pittii]|uniref:hypothetical protein n=1 Tax=Acinetobacter pittii TaxID=48296 RepID=UPI001022C7BD|nr:hypothetical protein [Acinetobacter pittii]RZH03127.1 hypothetical protein EXE01_04785 [Acinetobacter pittii]